MVFFCFVCLVLGVQRRVFFVQCFRRVCNVLLASQSVA